MFKFNNDNFSSSNTQVIYSFVFTDCNIDFVYQNIYFDAFFIKLIL